jgi:catechol 2,3-dioxygenase-like lactoylglutathione lyase family enzyme
MPVISLGENSKLTVLPSEREDIRNFYQDVLGCPLTRETERADFFRIGNNFNLGVVYEDSALSMSDRMKCIWLELNADHPEGLKRNILDCGIKEIEYFDKAHFYFQAPGGQVFRLVGAKASK